MCRADGTGYRGGLVGGFGRQFLRRPAGQV